MKKDLELTIGSIYVEGLGAEPVRTESYLEALSESEWVALRMDARRTKDSDRPAVRCGGCEAPAYLKKSIHGRRHCSHYGTEVRDCDWGEAHARNFRSIDADKFHGQQEGERHKQLKTIASSILDFCNEARAAGVVQERYTKGRNGDYAFPDVYAKIFQGYETAFEIQLATTQLPVITRREDFYTDNNIRLCWIVDGSVSDMILQRQTFKDIYMRNDGQLLGVDEEALAISRTERLPCFTLLRLLPDEKNGLRPCWKRRVVSLEDIAWRMPGEAPRSKRANYDGYLDTLVGRNSALSAARSAFYDALRIGDDQGAARIWSNVSSIVGGTSWDNLGSSKDAAIALGVLATMRCKEVMVQTKYTYENLVAIVNSMLLEPEKRRIWTKAFVQIAKIHEPELLFVSSVSNKVKRNLIDAAKYGYQYSDTIAGQGFNVFFPEGAFQRIR